MKILSVGNYNFKSPYNKNTTLSGGLQNISNKAEFDTVSFQSKYYKKDEPAIKTIETVKSRGGRVPESVERIAKIYSKNEQVKNIPLIEIHKAVFSALEDCKTLEEAKSIFPEFKNVKSVDEINASEGSSYDYYKKGLFTGQNNEEDKTLWLLKLYWNNLMPLRDFPGIMHNSKIPVMNIEDIFRKLNIPLMSLPYRQAISVQNK